MGAFNEAEFAKLMHDVKQFTAVLEDVHRKATNPTERELLGLAIASIKQGTADAETAVPAAADLIEREARQVITEGEQLQQDLEKEKARLDELHAANEKAEQEKEAKRPSAEELIGAVPVISGEQLRSDLFRALHLTPPADGAEGERADPQSSGGDIWHDWLRP